MERQDSYKKPKFFRVGRKQKTSTIYAGFIDEKVDKELFFIFICLP